MGYMFLLQSSMRALNITQCTILIPHHITRHRYYFIHWHWGIPTDMHLPTYFSSASLLLPYSSLPNTTRLANPRDLQHPKLWLQVWLHIEMRPKYWAAPFPALWFPSETLWRLDNIERWGSSTICMHSGKCVTYLHKLASNCFFMCFLLSNPKSGVRLRVIL